MFWIKSTEMHVDRWFIEKYLSTYPDEVINIMAYLHKYFYIPHKKS